MTISVCVKCGEKKFFGAWKACKHCGFHPSQDEDMALSFLLSDHYCDEKGLCEASKMIKSGESFTVPNEFLIQFRKDAKEIKKKFPNLFL